MMDIDTIEIKLSLSRDHSGDDDMIFINASSVGSRITIYYSLNQILIAPCLQYLCRADSSAINRTKRGIYFLENCRKEKHEIQPNYFNHHCSDHAYYRLRLVVHGKTGKTASFW
jgi:hypothetical protein